VEVNKKGYNMLKSELVNNFKGGDLLYGLRDIRDSFKKALRQNIGAKIPIIVDEYNSSIIAKFCDDGVFEETRYTSKLLDNERTHLKFLKDVCDEKVKITRNDFPANEKKLYNEERKTRRACKAALYKPDCTIHFCLDNIDIRQVFKRDYSLQQNQRDKNERCYYDLYTSAEIRFVCKNWDKLSEKVKFYNDGKQVIVSNEKNLEKGLEDFFSKNKNNKPRRNKILSVPPTPRKRARTSSNLRHRNRNPLMEHRFFKRKANPSLFTANTFNTEQPPSKRQKFSSAKALLNRSHF